MTADDEMPPDPFPPARIRPTVIDGAYQVAIETIPLNLDSPDLGVWCDTCLLPSALAYRFRILANGVELPRPVMTIAVCRDCGAVKRST